MMTGYMFGNAQYRLELQQSLEHIALPDPEEKMYVLSDIAIKMVGEVPDFALGTQKKVAGEVIRWNKITGPEKMDAVKYIEYLEAEIEELNRQVARKSLNGHNELLEYLKTLEPQNLKVVPFFPNEDCTFSVHKLMIRVTWSRTSVTETSAPELANLLFWLMVVGYSIHNIEVFFDMERIFGAPELVTFHGSQSQTSE
ncbi:unnamed protein product, partial [Musa acuminata subsp. burmannicoides]